MILPQTDLSMHIRKCAILISLILLLFSVESSAQFRTADFELIGPVESVESVTRPAFEPDKTETSGFLDSENYNSVFLKFDRRRNLILRENYLDYRGKLGLFDRTVYQINPANQIEKSETTLIKNWEEPQKISQRKTWYYLGNYLIRMDEFNFGRTSNQSWTTNSVYENSHLKEKSYWMEDEIFSKDIYEFDKNYNPISEKNYFNNGKLGKTIKYENTPFGLPRKIITTTGNDLEIKSFLYNLNYSSNVEFTDSNGRKIRIEKYGSDGRIVEIQKFNYNTKNYDVFDFIFEVDSYNNWIKCHISKNNQSAFTITRTIKYFNN